MAGSHPAFLSDQGYNKAAQPLASHLRHQAQQGVIRLIATPDGQPAPVSHQHADDTSLHVLQPSDAQAALDSSIALFCATTCSQQVSGFSGPNTAPCLNLTSCPPQHQLHHRPTDHLGVFFGYDAQAASHQQTTSTMPSAPKSGTGSNQVCSIPSSSDGGWAIPL